MKFQFLLHKISPLRLFIFQCFFLFGITLSANTALAQRIAPVIFSKLPQDSQLYPRNAQSEATVPIAGIVETAGYNYLSVQVLRNNALQKYLRTDLKYDKGTGSFSTETKIKAELANYNFRVYLCKGTDSTLIVERKNVVAGDVYVVSGQSNSTGFFTESDTSYFCRTFGKNHRRPQYRRLRSGGYIMGVFQPTSLQ